MVTSELTQTRIQVHWKNGNEKVYSSINEIIEKNEHDFKILEAVQV